MALDKDELKQISDAISKSIKDSFGTQINKLTDEIGRIVIQQQREIPNSALDYRGARFGSRVFGEDIDAKLRRLERDRDLQARDTGIATSGKRLFNGINKPGRELQYEKIRVEDTIEGYKNSIEDLKKTLNLSGLTDTEAINKAKENLKELGEEIDKYKSELEDLNNEFGDTDFTEAFSFDEDGNVLTANLDKVRELKDKYQDIQLTEGEIEDIAKRQYKAASNLNKKEEERNKVAGKIANVYDKQTDSLREQARYANMSIETMKKGFNQLKDLALKLVEGWKKVDQSSANFAKNIGVGNKGLVALRNNTIDMIANKGIGINYGIGMEELIEVQQNYSKAAGRNIGMTAEDVETGAAMSRLMGSKGSEFASALENFGLSYTEAGKRAGKMFADASKYGLSFEKYSDNFLKNIKLAQNYTFRDGLRGLERMAKKATEIRIDMQQIASFADKVSTLEGAVETSAQLQVLGGPFAQFSDPLGMLNEALNDTEGIMDRFENMTKGFSKFNSQTGQLDVNAFDKQRLRAAARAMNMDYGQVMESVQEQGRRNFIESQLKTGGRNFTDEEREFLMNTATVQGGKAKLSYFNDKGERIERNVNEITGDEIKKARAQNQSDTDNIKSIAKATMSINEQIKGWNDTVDAIKANWVEKPMNWIKSKLSGLGGYLKYFKFALGALIGAKAINAGANVISGARNFVKAGKMMGGARNLSKAGKMMGGAGNGAGNFINAARFFRAGAHGHVTGGVGGRIMSGLGKFGTSAAQRMSTSGVLKGTKFAKFLGSGSSGAAGVGVGAVAAGVAATAYGLYDSVKTIMKSAETKRERENAVAMGQIKKDSDEDKQLTRKAKKEKGEGIGKTAGTAIGAAIGTIIAPGIGTAIGAGIGWLGGKIIGGAIGKKRAEKEIEKRHKEAIEEQRLNSILQKHGFGLKGGYNKDEYNQIMSAINQNGDNTITKAEFENLPEELRKKMMENGDVTLFPDLQEYKVDEGTFDVQNATLNANNLTIKGDIGKDKKANGGLLNGPSHAQGGMPIVGSNIEVEGGEYVVNKKATRDNIGLLNAINKMGDGGMISPVVNTFVKPIGVLPNAANINKMGDGGMISPVVDTFVKPIGVLPNAANINKMSDGGIMGMQPINVNINGTIKLDGGNGKQIDMGALLRDPVFIRQISNLIEQQLIYTTKGARYTNKIRS